MSRTKSRIGADEKAGHSRGMAEMTGLDIKALMDQRRLPTLQLFLTVMIFPVVSGFIGLILQYTDTDSEKKVSYALR